MKRIAAAALLVLFAAACGGGGDDVGSSVALLNVAGTVASAEGVPEGCEGRLAFGDDVTVRTLVDASAIAVAYVDGVATCVDDVDAIATHLEAAEGHDETEGDVRRSIQGDDREPNPQPATPGVADSSIEESPAAEAPVSGTAAAVAPDHEPNPQPAKPDEEPNPQPGKGSREGEGPGGEGNAPVPRDGDPAPADAVAAAQ